MITILGSSGFIGSQLLQGVQRLGLPVLIPKRDENLAGKKLGSIIYCVGLTADFRARPLETVEAHVCKLLEIVRECDFDSLLYLSSARLYSGLVTTATEDAELHVSPLNADHIYNVSKIMGEALLFASGRNVKVARISNVYGNDFSSQNFLSSLIRDAISLNKVVLRSSPDSEKDYISISDVATGLLQIVRGGKHEIYNLAAGVSISNEDLVSRISQLTGCDVEFVANAPKITFPTIDVGRMREEFGFSPANILDDLKILIDLYRSSQKLWNDDRRS